MKIRYSVIVPVYKNEASIKRLLATLEELSERLNGEMEAVLVVDGSPDNSFNVIKQHLTGSDFPIQLVAHSRNFGSFPAIRTGLRVAKGRYFGVMAADLQEPPELIMSFFQALQSDECDVAVGRRVGRADSLWSSLSSSIFWWLYRKMVNAEMPNGGVDIFGCNELFRDQLLRLRESHSSLVALVFWLGFRRKSFDYERLKRLEGKSAWTFSKKLEYMMDSVFAFTNLPIRILTGLGVFGLVLSGILAVIVITARLTGNIDVPGYAPTILAILGLGSLNLLGLGLVGNYAWRTYENSKSRPLAIEAILHQSKHYDE